MLTKTNMKPKSLLHEKQKQESLDTSDPENGKKESPLNKKTYVKPNDKHGKQN
jgi:hypothetical protein